MKKYCIVLALVLTGCITQTKTTTLPDGTVIVEKLSAPSAEAINAGVTGVAVLAPIIIDSNK